MKTWRRALSLGLILGAGLSASCTQRLVERDPFDPRMRCAIIIAYVEEPGQERFRLLNSQTDLLHDQWCTCTTHEEWETWPLDEEFAAWVQYMAYEACLDFVTREGYDPAHSDCLETYESGFWSFGLAMDDISEDPAFCDAGEPPPGCGIE